MSGLRFCFPTTFYPPYNFGGDGINVQRLARALVKRGHHVTVVHDIDAFHAARGRVARGFAECNDGVEVVRLSSSIGRLSALATQQTGYPLGKRKQLRAILGSGKFDVINYHNVSLIGGPGILAYGDAAAKLYTAHDHWLICPTHVLWRHQREPCPSRQCIRCQLVYRRPPQLWRYLGVLERNLHHLDEFLAFSEFSRKLHQEFGFPRSMKVVPGFIPEPPPDTGVRVSPHHRPFFLFAGRLERMKGLDDVIPVFAGYPDADLVIAGQGIHREALEELAAGAGNIHFIGRVEFDQLRDYFRNAIATIVSSTGFETFGSVAIESLSEGTPVIARDRGAPARDVTIGVHKFGIWPILLAVRDPIRAIPRGHPSDEHRSGNCRRFAR